MKPYIYYLPKPKRSRFDAIVMISLYTASGIISFAIAALLYTILR